MSFGLLFQALLPATGLPSTSGGQALAALCVSGHADDGSQNNTPDDPHAGLCRAICALIHVAQFVVAPEFSYAIALPPARSQRIDLRADERSIIVRAAIAYSSRAPPAAA